MKAKLCEKVFVITRHAHRDKPFGSAFDNGLSPKGINQTKKLTTKLWRQWKHLPKQKVLFLSSPKIRCQETLKPLTKKFRKRLHMEPLLDEGGPLKTKILAFLKKYENTKHSHIFLNSHGDWIPMFYKLTAGKRWELKKGKVGPVVFAKGNLCYRCSLPGLAGFTKAQPAKVEPK